MSILFYDHLIDKSEVVVLIDSLEIPPAKKSRFKTIVDDILHNGILEYLLQKLHPHQHHRFLTHLSTSPYDPELLSFLRRHVGETVDTEIQQEAKRLLSHIIKDLRS